MLDNTKKNFKELGKDIKTLLCTSVALVKDTVTIPVSLCKDVRDSALAAKEAKKTKSKAVIVVQNNPA